jgi:AcrR family transcriptional regulator
LPAPAPAPDRATHRTKLLAAAQRLLRERDYADITARDLVATSSTNLGSIGYHFGSKEALLNEAIGLALEDWAEHVIASAQPDPRVGPMGLVASLAAVLDEFDSIRPFYHAFIEALARSARAPQLRAQLAAHYNRQRDRLAGWIVDSLGSGCDRGDARRLASVMIATVDGLLIQAFVDPGDTPGGRDLTGAAAWLRALAQDHPSSPAQTR